MFVVADSTAARRRFPVYLVDATDGITPETGEAAGQPQISKNGGAWANTSATLTHVGNGTYYVELTTGELSDAGKISCRYKSGNTAEFSLTLPVYAFDLFVSAASSGLATASALATAQSGITAIDGKTTNLPSDPADQSLVIAATTAIFDRLGAPAGASVSADVAAVKSDTAAIAAKTTNLPSDPADQSAVEAAITAATSGLATAAALSTAQSGITAIDSKTTNLPSDPADQSLIIAATDAVMTRLGAPVGASLSADIAAKAAASSVSAVASDIARTLGLQRENCIDDNHQYDPTTGLLTTCRRRLFASKAAADAATKGAANGADNETARYTLTFTFDGDNHCDFFKSVRDAP